MRLMRRTQEPLHQTHLGTSSSDPNGSSASSGIPGGGAGDGAGSSSSASVSVEPIPSASSSTPLSFSFVFRCPSGCVLWIVWVRVRQRKRPSSYQATYLQTHTLTHGRTHTMNVVLMVCCERMWCQWSVAYGLLLMLLLVCAHLLLMV